MRHEPALVNAEITNQLLLLLGPESFRNVVSIFNEQATNTSEQIHSSVRTESYTEIVSLSHAMKGSASTVGCDVLAELYRLIEITAISREFGKLKQLVTELQNTTVESVNTLSSYT